MHEDKKQTSGILRITHYLEDGLLVILLAAMIILSVSQILLRNFFDSGIVWAQPLLGVLVLWIGLAGSIVASRQKNHISINILSHYLGNRGKLIAEIIIELFTSIVSGIVAYHAGRFVISEYEYKAMAFENVPAWVCELILPVAFSMICLRYFAHAANNLVLFLNRKPAS